MSMSKKKHNIPSLQQFLDYIHRRMDSRQQHSFEQQMQKDAFAEEAMEGLTMLDEDRIRRDIDRLNQNIRGTGRSKRAIWLGSIAASIALLVVVSTAFWAVERTRKLQERSILTLEEPLIVPDLQEEDIFRPDTPPDTAQQPSTILPHSASVPVATEDAEFYVDAETMEEHLPQIAIRNEEPPAAIAGQRRETLIVAAEEAPPVPSMQSPQRENDIRIRGVATQTTATHRELKGQVVDALDGSPIPGVTILIAGTTQGVITDQEGRFTIQAPPGEDVKLIASFIGMQPKEFNAHQLAENQTISMDTDIAALSEVVVVGYGTQRGFPQDYVEPDYKKSTSYLPPEPVGGQRAFRRYINEQAIIPPSWELSRAVVIVDFDVDTQGRLSDFRFIRSPGLAFEEKAKTILLGGPQWQPATLSGAPLKETVRVRMVFRK